MTQVAADQVSSHAGPRREVPSRADILTMKAITTFYRRMVLLDRDLSDPLPEVEPRPPMELRQATSADLPAYRAFHPDQPEAVAEARFARGDECFAVWDEGRIVHAAWAATERAYVGYLRRDLVLQPDEMYAYDAFTRPSHRGMGLCSLRGIHMLQHYRERGYAHSFGLAAVENQAGFAQVRAVGYVPTGLYTCVRLGPWQRHGRRPFGNERLPALARPKA